MESLQNTAGSILHEPQPIYTYQYLRNVNSFGYRSESRNGVLYHCLTQDIMISLLHYHREKNVKVSMYLTEVPLTHEISDEEMPRHQNDFIELTYVLSGEITVTVDHEEMVFCENELYLINPNVPYQEQKNRSTALVMNISLRASFFNEMLLSSIHENSLQSFLRNCLMEEKNHAQVLRFTPAISSEQKKISDIYSLILEEYKTKQTGYMLVIQGYFIRLLDHLVSNFQFTFTEDDKNRYRNYLFEDVKKYMYTHYQDIRLTDLAEQFHYQDNFFNRLIQDYTGKTYSAYLIYIRMKMARDMLEFTARSIEEIMDAVGYHNKGFFYKAFLAEYGKTPAAYRKDFR